MIINDFAKVGTKVGEVLVKPSPRGFTAEVKKGGWDIICSTTRSEVRYWKSLDVIRKHLLAAGFRGLMVVSTDSQDFLL